MRVARLLSTLLFVTLAFGCGRQSPVAPARDDSAAIPKVDLTELDRIERATRLPALWLAGGNPKLVIVPAGSVDALTAAIAQVGPGGTVVLESGVHTESGTVEISDHVTLVGEPGAVLVTDTNPLAAGIEPALWVHGAAGVTIRDIEFKPSGAIGNTAILLQNAPNANVLANNVHDYRFGILVERADRSKVWQNRVACSAAWQVGGIPDAYGIVVINGTECLIANNRVSDGLFGIWPCDRGGRAIGNRINGCFVGLILCKVPAGGFTLPDGGLAGAELSSANWLVQSNEAFGNFTVGILAIDGANNSNIVDNNSHDNGTYDVEMTGDTYRFGFLTPAAYDCKFVAGSYPNVRVKDCGNGNRVVGGLLVDNGVDPCY